MNDIYLNKRGIILRCLARIEQEYAGDPERLQNATHQDAVVLNLLRACEAAIDLAMHVVAQKGIGLPKSSKDAFDLLTSAGLLDTDLSESLRRMVGFRNVAVHEYQSLSIEVLQSILQNRLGDFTRFLQSVKQVLGA